MGLPIMGLQIELEKLYSLISWVEDPETPQGIERYRQIRGDMEQLINYNWIKEFLKDRRIVRVIDVCSGTGLAGIALSKVLVEKGFEVKLTLLDLRSSALEKARKHGLRELGLEPSTLLADVTQPLELEKQDIALVWGSTTPHFNPWTWLKVLANVSKLLVDNGLFMYDKSDRVYGIFIRTGFRELIPIVEEGGVTLDIYVDRDAGTGYTRRACISIPSGKRAELNTYYWDIASSAAFTWVFFEDVDFAPIRPQVIGVIIARGPRRNIPLSEFTTKNPAIISQVNNEH